MKFLSRVLSAVVGLFLGALLGMLGLYFLMLLVGSDFGLDSVRPGALFGALVGLVLGLWFPDKFA